MCDISSQISNIESMFTGKLIEGNHDSITLFGIHPQNKLKEYSNLIFNLMLRDSGVLGSTIDNIMSELKSFDSKTKFEPHFLYRKRKHQEKIINEFNSIIQYIDNMTLILKLQQTQIIKEIKYLEKLQETIDLCSEEIKRYIEYGSEFHKNHISTNDSKDDLWFLRLEKRLADLSVSYMLSIQSHEQIKLLHENDLLLLDKITSIISTTFPTWQSQMTILLGVQLLDNRITNQNKIIGYVDKQIKNTKHLESDSLDTEKISQLNNYILEALTEMNLIDQQDCSSRKEFQRKLQKKEGGIPNE